MKWISSEDKKNLINLLILHGPLFYFSFSTAMGASNNKEDGAGPLFKVFLAILFVLGVFPIVKIIIRNRCTKKFFLPIFFVSVYILIAFLNLSFDEDNFFLQLVCFSVPAVCVALSIDKQRGLAGVMKWFDLFLPLLAFSFVFLIKNIVLSKLTSDESAYSQDTSYYAAYCFVVDVFLIRYKNNYSPFKLLQNKWYNLLKLLLLPYFFALCMFGGGRGAFVLLIVCGIFNLDLLKRVSIRNIFKICFYILIILVVMIVLVGKVGEYYDILMSGFDRVSTLFDGGKIDTSASSGRDNIWRDAFNTWSLSPLYGYGLFSYLDYFYIRPHNIFLELLLQGGILLLLFFFIIFFCSFFKYKNMLRIDKSQIFLTPYILYISTLLMFSGSYWMETFFWFVLTYIYAYNFKRVKNVKTSK